MEEQLITFETAKLAKEKGFSINTTEYWEYQASGPERYKFITEDSPGATWVNDDLKNRICISTQSLLQKWLREKHNIHIRINDVDGSEGVVFHCMVLNYNSNPMEYKIIPYKEDLNIVGLVLPKIFKTYEEALEVGLEEGLKTAFK